MSLRKPPALANWLLDQSGFTGQNPPLAGDLLEEFRDGRSAAWYWHQALAVIVTGLVTGIARNARLNRRPLMAGIVGSVSEICYLLAPWWFLRPPQSHAVAERIAVFLVAMLVTALVLLAREKVLEQYQRAMLGIAGCVWFVGFLITYWLIARFDSAMLPAFVALQAFGLLRAVERVLKPNDPGQSWARVFTGLKESASWLR